MNADVDIASCEHFVSFDDAWQHASILARNHECTYLVCKLAGNAGQYIVEEDAGQGGAIAAVTADPREAVCLTFRGREIVPLPATSLPAANDR